MKMILKKHVNGNSTRYFFEIPEEHISSGTLEVGKEYEVQVSSLENSKKSES